MLRTLLRHLVDTSIWLEIKRDTVGTKNFFIFNNDVQLVDEAGVLKLIRYTFSVISGWIEGNRQSLTMKVFN